MPPLVVVAGAPELRAALFSQIASPLHQQFALYRTRKVVVVSKYAGEADIATRAQASNFGLHWTQYHPNGYMEHDCGLHWMKSPGRPRGEDPPPAPRSWADLDADTDEIETDPSNKILADVLERGRWGWALEGIGLSASFEPTPDPLLTQLAELGVPVRYYICQTIPELERGVWVEV